MRLLCICIHLVACVLWSTNGKGQLTYKELEVQYDSVWQYKSLQLIPVKFKEGQTLSLPASSTINLSDALRSRQVSIREIAGPAGSDVNVLAIKNHSRKYILIRSGEMLKGGKQDRVVATTLLIPPGTEESYLSVFCIEKGRWDSKIKQFQYAGNADMALRKKILKGQQQHEIWKEIDRQFNDKKLLSETWPYLELYKTGLITDSAAYLFFKNKMEKSDSAFAGFVAVDNGNIIHCELFGTNELYALSYLGMIQSLLANISLTPNGAQVKEDQVRSFLDKFLLNQEQQKNYLKLHGKIFQLQNHIIHLIAYDE